MFVWTLSYKTLANEYVLTLANRPFIRHTVMEALDWVCEKTGHRICQDENLMVPYNKIAQWVEAADDNPTDLPVSEEDARVILPQFVEMMEEDQVRAAYDWSEIDGEEEL